ncbi:gamma DNA-directed DNA polymerase [Fomitopsis serialis]|uniref:gamma DNA-directed DNA polymerase n=1 Tax=Fomitopsis serialis TaxID=139415 RepID=UPI0020077B21|nr:gamma DNA-directed DNA polymerase [Neoantrodia serialis]KAH9916034.1 gamma DNA-directed DNA polymerase [Neoantrodia serialis]
MLAKSLPVARRSRLFHTSLPTSVLQQKPLPTSAPKRAVPDHRSTEQEELCSQPTQEVARQEEVKRNQVGVQLLSRQLHQQIFRNISFPSPESSYVHIAREHLKTHGLDPAQGSVLPNTSFTLPPLQGRNLDEHFHAIGASAAHPWLSLAKDLAGAELPPRPDHWNMQAGWTRYLYQPDGSSYYEHVECPEFSGQAEEMLVFDVETMPEYSPYAVMACAASKNAWYSWVSPWLLGETEESKQLIPMGGRTVPRVVVGHNVSYDRGRVLEEYSVDGTQTRFIDTMALHVAVKGISSHQRPAWAKYRKTKEKAQQQKEEAIEAVLELMRQAEERRLSETDPAKVEELGRLLHDLEEGLPSLQAEEFEEAEEDEMSCQRWEDLTSANSLADVAKLHCDIDMDKAIRNDFMTSTREEILQGVQDYLNYCAGDVAVTHAVFSKVLPSFLNACPNPVSFAGVLTMGSSFLTVNEKWDTYLAEAERTYKELEEKVKRRLQDLACQAKGMMDDESWKSDVWLSQLDWTPKVAGKTRGVKASTDVPTWYASLLKSGTFSSVFLGRVMPLLLRSKYDGVPLQYSAEHRWHWLVSGEVCRPLKIGGTGRNIFEVFSAVCGLHGLRQGRLVTDDDELAFALSSKYKYQWMTERVMAVAEKIVQMDKIEVEKDPSLRQLDWTPVRPPRKAHPTCQGIIEDGVTSTEEVTSTPKTTTPKTTSKGSSVGSGAVKWPKWFWDLAKPKKDAQPGTLDLTVRSRLAPLLLRLSWQGWPLFHSREHGWTFRVPPDAGFETRAKSVAFPVEADAPLRAMADEGYMFYKLPHKDGDEANVGSPLGKTFMKYAQDGTLTSPGDEAKDALDMNAQCSYWISARDRVLNQMVVWQDERVKAGLPQPAEEGKKWGIILPQVITMGTVTRRAIEKTWLTASNAKKNRVGSELKAMVRAPEGYAIVGADVDSEELWISSVMGDAQFGLHGATAIGWMTLEGTKAAGTDLHSKTASILGISRDQAKVFNYSRIYGAGMRHAVLLLLQSNAGMLPEQAQKLAQNLYASTKGKNTHRGDLFGRKFWYGGTESFVFNKLEEIALSDRPQTPALGCGVTYALSKEYLPATFGDDYMPSRINWVVQSSGVDYLHLLIVSMEHLIKKYNIQARYLISVHDELRYLVKEEDRYRAALALQIANLWTRSLFAYKLGMDDLPQGVAFFSAVDVDKVLRKEVDMPCVTPSQPIPIPPGESLDIAEVLEKTGGGSLWPNGAPMVENDGIRCGGDLVGYRQPDCLVHRAESAAWLRAQTISDVEEIKQLAMDHRAKFGNNLKKTKSKTSKNVNGLKRLKKVRALGDGDGVDWNITIEQLLKSLDMLS